MVETILSSSLIEVKTVMVGTQSVKLSDRSEDSDGGNPVCPLIEVKIVVVGTQSVQFSNRSEDTDGGNPFCPVL